LAAKQEYFQVSSTDLNLFRFVVPVSSQYSSPTIDVILPWPPSDHVSVSDVHVMGACLPKEPTLVLNASCAPPLLSHCSCTVCLSLNSPVGAPIKGLLLCILTQADYDITKTIERARFCGTHSNRVVGGLLLHTTRKT
jgi:hypothetical protein